MMGGLAFHATSLSSLLTLQIFPQTKKEKVQSPNPSLVATTIACKHVGCEIPSMYAILCVHKALGCNLYWNKGPLKVDLRATTTPVKFDAKGFTMGKDPSCMAR